MASDEIVGVSGSRRALDVILGVVVVAVSVGVLLSPGLGLLTLLFVLSVAFVASGVAILMRGLGGRNHPAWVRGLRAIVGLLTILLGLVVLSLPVLGVVFLTAALAAALLVLGFGNLIPGLSPLSVGSRRIVRVLLGLLDIFAAAVVIIAPGLAVLTLIAILSIALLFTGLHDVWVGVTGVDVRHRR